MTGDRGQVYITMAKIGQNNQIENETTFNNNYKQNVKLIHIYLSNQKLITC